MRVIVFLISAVSFYSCTWDKDPIDYSNGFLQLADKCENDMEYLRRQIDSMGVQIKGTWKMDSALFKTGIATTSRLTEKFELLTDSLDNAQPFNGDTSIKKKAVKLLRLYSNETLPVFALFIRDHYNVYGKNDILSLNALKQDSLNQIIIKSQEKMLAASEKQETERQNFVNYIFDWEEKFKEKREKHDTQQNVYATLGEV